MQSIFLKTNVTSIKFVGRNLLAGIGGEIHVFSATNEKSTCWKQIHKIRVFPSQNIYGISIRENKLLVYGGRQIAVLDCTLEPLKIFVTEKGAFNDWILDAVWLDNESDVAILSANNIVSKYNVTSGKTNQKEHCDELCILYSGKILNSVWEELIILAGTVFQEIVVWPISTKKDNCIVHRLKGHKGVIFSINYDPRYDLISSTSDDRTIRIWMVHFRSKEKKSWNDCSISLKVTIFSHVARVWKSKIISENKFISVGEDSLISIWNGSGDCINKWYGHQSGAIWSVDFSEDMGLIATGGSDGGINIWPLCNSFHPFSIYQSPPYEAEHLPKSVALSLKGNIILLTNQGALLLYKDNEWITCFEDTRFSTYCILQMSPCRRFLAMGAINGVVTISKVENNNINKIWDGQILEGRVFSLLWLSENMVIICGPDGRLILLQCIVNENECDLKPLKEYILPKCKERWITSAVMVEDYLLCGDRCGSIYLYDVHTFQKEPLHTIRKLHGYKGVTALKFIDGTILSTGRDGIYKQLEIKENLIKVIETNKMQMEWIATIEKTLSCGIVIVGFHGVDLIIWSCMESRPLLRLDCGGGHRSWDLLVNLNNESDALIVTFIKDKNVYTYNQPIYMVYQRNAEVGYHSKSINASCYLAFKSDSDDFILTGGEDNSLRLFSWNGDTFTPHFTLNRHISSIRAVYSIKDESRNAFYVASCGGRGQLIFWQILQCKGKVRIIETATYMVREPRLRHDHSTPLPDPETRCMDVNIVKTSETVFLILVGCSDGIFRILNYDIETSKINLVKDCHFHDHCILKVAHFIWEKIIAITMTTEGNLSFWNVDDLLSESDKDFLPITYNLHTLGINSYGLILEKDILILATGSDDATLALTVFGLKNKNKHLLLTSWIEKSIHTCQITGVQILGNFIATAALDQKISLLKWKFNNGILNVALVKQIATSVPDIHGLVAWFKPQNTINICVYGLGIELFKQTIEEEEKTSRT